MYINEYERSSTGYLSAVIESVIRTWYNANKKRKVISYEKTITVSESSH